jgi:hypothetical protein
MFNPVFGSQDPLPLAWGYPTFTIEHKIFTYCLNESVGINFSFHTPKTNHEVFYCFDLPSKKKRTTKVAHLFSKLIMGNEFSLYGS